MAGLLAFGALFAPAVRCAYNYAPTNRREGARAMAIVGMAEMRKIFAIIDKLGIHREKIEVPLKPEGSGRIEMLDSGIARIVLPADKPLDEWIPTLEAELDKLPIRREQVDYSKLTAVLIEAVKELKAENEELRERIYNLEVNQ